MTQDTRDTLPALPETNYVIGIEGDGYNGGDRCTSWPAWDDDAMRAYAAAAVAAATAQQAAELARLRADADRLRYALGDSEGKLTTSQLTRRAYELFQKAANWNDWCGAQNRVETDMPEGWAFVIQCSPGDWDTYLTDPDGERVSHRDDCETLAQQMHSAVDVARAARQDGPGEQG